LHHLLLVQTPFLGPALIMGFSSRFAQAGRILSGEVDFAWVNPSSSQAAGVLAHAGDWLGTPHIIDASVMTG
jgi:hypothetical protein